ncbi:AbrB family transcriptional regulator [Methylobrevis pamukkalensis]|uniref:Putative ammonia monooxygenase n=1 Tax=Methylobrevis pamukkalensis TaxID=1439726 RepID=A0A1E3H7N1_9HYPH|nr:AbrB family transcriptional regulator [Methylobrevis pamukkalensis]ODN72349.1 putative ammonia monooxygenase [Methylobrevis pamukkalensis]
MPSPSGALWRLALALCAGALGGTLFALIGLPAPWLSGSMLAVGALALSGFRARMPTPARNAVFILLGTSMGSGVTPDLVGDVALWPFSLVILTVTVAAIGTATYLWLRRASGWDAPSAFFAAVPGALSYVLVLAEESRADVARVALSQTIRVFLLVAVLPGLVTALEGVVGGARVVPVRAAAGGLDLALMAAAGLVAGLAGLKARLPAGALVGAFAASAALHGFDIVHGVLPPGVLIAGFVFLGTFMGLRFSGTRWRDLFAGLAPALGAFAVGAAVSVAGAGLVSLLLGLPFGQSLVAFAPGGLEAMMILAFTLGFTPPMSRPINSSASS